MVKTLFQFTLGLFLVTSTALSASAGYSSLYVFGDALSATNDNNPDSGSPGPPSYYGYRWSNGRVWVEVLAQRQGVSFPYNNSYWDHNSTLTAVDVTSFIAPPDVANDLFVVWVCNADTFDAASDISYNPSTSYNALLNQFISENIQAQANNLLIITQLYAKGVRTLIMPNAVDISEYRHIMRAMPRLSCMPAVLTTMPGLPAPSIKRGLCALVSKSILRIIIPC